MTNLITKAKDFYTGHKKLVVVLGILFLILLPQLTTSNYVRGVLARIIVYATIASGLNIINGYSGQSCLGIVRTFQNIKLFKYLSVLENVKVGCHIHTRTNVLDALLHTPRYRQDEEYATQQAAKVLEEVGLTEYKDWKAGNLPYGLQRKVEIARALAANPKILLLDEPAAGMNPAETWSLLEFIQRINKSGHTIVVIEHDMKFVMNLCDYIMVLSFGEKICEGTPDVVKNDKKVQEAYFGRGTIQKSNER